MHKRLKHSILLLLFLFIVASGMKSISKDNSVFFGNKTTGKPSDLSESLKKTAFLITKTGKIALEIANTEGKRVRGLSGREQLADGVGMLFIFPTDGIYSIWMKDMNFSIDIVWVDKDFKIVDIEENVSPDTYPNSFSSGLPARYVLELGVGTVQMENLIVGQSLLFENLP